MSFAAACGWSLVRSLAVATIGVVLAVRLTRSLRSTDGWRARMLWGLLLLPLFLPGLLVGYGYRNFSLSLVHHPVWNELVYAGLVLLLFVPVATLIVLASPPAPISPAGLHAAKLLNSQRSSVLPLWIRSRLYAALPAWAALFLLTFQETEVATLMQAAGWPEWTFTRLATGMPMPDVLPRLLIAVAIQLVVILAAGFVVVSGNRPRTAASVPVPISAGHGFLYSYAAVAITSLLILPGSFVLRGAWEGVSVLAAHPALLEQISIALLFGVTSGLLAWMASGMLAARLRDGRRLCLVSLCLLPGLLGAWTLGLLLAGLFQLPLLQPIYRTPLPMILGEVLFQLPRAVLVRLLLGQLQSSSAVHSARLLAAADDAFRRGRGADLLWQLDRRGRVMGCLLVCYWAYMELSIPSPALLGPPGMTTAPVLLYNQMHYGQIPGLSALVLATVLVPVVCVCAAALGSRSLVVWQQRSARTAGSESSVDGSPPADGRPPDA